MKTSNNPLFIICNALIFLAVFLYPGLQVSAADLEQIKKLDEEVLQHKKKIEKVQTGIASHQTKVAAAREREMLLLDELDKIDQQISAESEKLLALQEEMARQNEMTLTKQKEMEKVAQEKDDLRLHMESRLRAYYRMGDVGVMNTLFSSSSLADLLSFRDYFVLMLKSDQQLINDFKNKMHELEEVKKAHEEEKIRLSQAAEEVMQQQELLSQTQQERQELFERVKTERQLYQQALKELEDASQQLTATLTALEEKATEAKVERERQLIRDYPLKPFKKRKPASARGFASEKGKLPLPVAGSIMQQFGTHTDETSGASTFANGINIESAPGSDIIAVYDSKVVYAGTLRGYGNLIILDHGNHYYSLVSGVGEILRKVGDMVKQHEKIGVTSLHTGLLKEGLHFEIRHNTEAQNPLEWLESSQRSLKK
ncbi:MAG: peptidoglycan DD-metalloendopeptidase family protein [Desulfobulbaceae bacterium]|nr:peptidoglycan DD-metalloendopeptidase family protein [Pseudomonadota bacterium]MCG2746702.1 peptidoglycan DD-metalloendopeptidase family protein [Desulfobulbaceae bacterium]